MTERLDRQALAGGYGDRRIAEADRLTGKGNRIKSLSIESTGMAEADRSIGKKGLGERGVF